MTRMRRLLHFLGRHFWVYLPREGLWPHRRYCRLCPRVQVYEPELLAWVDADLAKMGEPLL